MDLHERVLSRLVGNTRHTVGINGLDCSGKSTFAASLNRFLSSREITSVVLNVDDYNDLNFQKRFYQRYVDGGRRTIDLDEYYRNSIDYRALVAAINDVNNDRGVVIVEGVFLFKPVLVDLFDTKVFLEVSYSDAIARFERRRTRVGDQRPVSVMTDIWIPAFELYLERCDPKGVSDIVQSVLDP